MSAKLVVPGLHEVKLGFVNAFLLETDDGLALIDTGIPGSDAAILGAVREIGRQPAEVRQILVTHCHSDHAGSLAALKRLTGASAWMHPEDAAMVRAGSAMRPVSPAPGLLNALLFRLVIRSAPTSFEAAEVEREVRDGEELPIAGGLRAVHVPGHCAGQLAFLWPRHGGVLIAADAAANVLSLVLSPAYEDLAEGRRSLSKLASLDFEVACFGHGRPIQGGASKQFRRKWAQARQPDPAPA
jgi:glyoxylase-like metal-dependent hydrolase (beta-lactamase superfamily II)